MDNDSTVTAHLVEQVAAGNPEALEFLFQRHRTRLERMIGLRLDPRLRVRYDVADIVQETYLEVRQRLEDYLARRPMPFALWLIRTARQHLTRLHRDHAVAHCRSVLREEPWPDRSSQLLAARLPQNRVGPADLVAQREYQQLVVQVVARLDPDDRDLLVMRHVEDLTHAEIAHILGAGEATVRKRYARALDRLRIALERAGLGDDAHGDA